jgi:hypothetical protein
MSNKRYRVAVWGTGHTGLKALRGVIEHPHHDLVAVRVYTDGKVGKDAGELCGLQPTGVIATQDREVIVTARPDCVLYMPSGENTSIDDIAHLLESGANVITLVTDHNAYRHPPSMEPAVRKTLEEACARGKTSLYATGPSPGFITEQFPLTVLGMMRGLDCMTINEYADMSERNSPEMIAMMFGRDPSKMDLTQVAKNLEDHFGKSFLQIAEAIGLPIDEFTSTGSVAVAKNDTHLPVATIKAGTVAAWYFEVAGLHNGKPLMKFKPTWFVTEDLEPPLQLRDTGWKVIFEGDPPFEIDIHMERGEKYWEIQPGYNAYILINAIPNVCEAAPGLRTTVELPPIVPKFT